MGKFSIIGLSALLLILGASDSIAQSYPSAQIAMDGDSVYQDFAVQCYPVPGNPGYCNAAGMRVFVDGRGLDGLWVYSPQTRAWEIMAGGRMLAWWTKDNWLWFKTAARITTDEGDLEVHPARYLRYSQDIGSPPPLADCDSPNEVGRFVPERTNHLLWWCFEDGWWRFAAIPDAR